MLSYEKEMLKTRRAPIVLLLADGFDEAAVGVVLPALREAGLAVSLVGLRATRLTGAHGLVVVPDLSLDQLLEGTAPVSALILSGGAGHLARLRVDPRVAQLLRHCIEGQTVLAGLDQEATVMIERLVEPDNGPATLLTPQRGANLKTFTATVIRQVLEIWEG